MRARSCGEPRGTPGIAAVVRTRSRVATVRTEPREPPNTRRIRAREPVAGHRRVGPRDVRPHCQASAALAGRHCRDSHGAVRPQHHGRDQRMAKRAPVIRRRTRSAAAARRQPPEPSLSAACGKRHEIPMMEWHNRVQRRRSPTTRAPRPRTPSASLTAAPPSPNYCSTPRCSRVTWWTGRARADSLLKSVKQLRGGETHEGGIDVGALLSVTVGRLT